MRKSILAATLTLGLALAACSQADQTANDLGNAADSAGDTLGNAADQAGDAIENAADVTGRKLENLTEDADHAADDFGNSVKNETR